MEVEIENGNKQKMTVDITYGKLTDTVCIDAFPTGVFTITGKSARNLRDVLIKIMIGSTNEATS